jgi:hypothetical protein
VDNLIRGKLNPRPGFLSDLWKFHQTEVIIGHPTFKNADNIGRQLARGILGAAQNFANRKVAFVVTDGTWTEASRDTSSIEAALQSARETLTALPENARQNIQVVATPYEGYRCDRTPGKGSALKMIFDEMEDCSASMLILLDGDLKNDMAAWQRVFAAVEGQHREKHGEKPFFVTARYARHFVDASLTRFIVGPLTTLLGRYVPGGISGDIVLSANAVAHERQANWTEARRKYGTDISTTFDNLADPACVIYEVYLGAKLHDITDEAKLSVMPGEVIGAALERLLHWESVDGRVTRMLSGGELAALEIWGPERTGIDFIDPGFTDAFNLDAKIDTLLTKFPDFEDDIRVVQGPEFYQSLKQRITALSDLKQAGTGELKFLSLDPATWIQALYRAVAYALKHQDLELPKRCLNYLYTAAFLEFVKDKLLELGQASLDQVRSVQSSLGVPASESRKFYQEGVDGEVDRLALQFFDGRARIRELMKIV